MGKCANHKRMDALARPYRRERLRGQSVQRNELFCVGNWRRKSWMVRNSGVEVRILFAGQYPDSQQRKVGQFPESQACGAERWNDGRFYRDREKPIAQMLMGVW